jgi:HlyD family secretion protein
MSDALALPDAAKPTAETAAQTPAAKPPSTTPAQPTGQPAKPGTPAPSPPPQDDKKRAPRSLRSWLMIALGAVLVLAVVLYLLRNVLLGTPTPVFAASSGQLVQSVVASGRVVSPQRVTVALQGSGRVLRVAVAEGQTVEQGQLLIELDNSDARASLAQARAAVAQAQARVRQLRELNQPVAAQALTQAQATALLARKALARNRDLVAQGFISQAALDDAQRAVAVADSQVASAQAQATSNTQTGSDAALAQAALAQAVAGQQLASVKLAQGQVLAPSGGVLISRDVEVGDIVQPGKALIKTCQKLHWGNPRWARLMRLPSSALMPWWPISTPVWMPRAARWRSSWPWPTRQRICART